MSDFNQILVVGGFAFSEANAARKIENLEIRMWFAEFIAQSLGQFLSYQFNRPGWLIKKRH